MAKSAPAPAYEPERTYTLVVSRPVSDGPFKYLPRHSVEAKGSLINRLVEENGADVIASAEPLD